MPAVPLADVVAYADEFLRIREVADERNAVNGLQVENKGSVSGIVAAVDASQATIDGVAGRGSLLVVHHGLLWDGNVPLTGRRYRRISTLLENDVALYAAHIPLDLHPEVGNNVVLADRLGIEVEGWFGDYKGSPIGVWGFAPARLTARETLLGEVNRALGTFAPGARLIPGGPERVSRVGIITGGAGSMIGEATDRRARHLHHRRGRPPHLLRRRRVGPQRHLRRPLRHRDPRRTGAGLPSRRAVRPGMGVPRPPDRTVTPALELAGIHKTVRLRARAARGRFHVAAGRAPRASGRERRREDHAHADRRRSRPARLGRGSDRRDRAAGPLSPRGPEARHRDGASALHFGARLYGRGKRGAGGRLAGGAGAAPRASARAGRPRRPSARSR